MRSLGIRRTGSEIRASRARRITADLAPTIKGIQADGVSTLSGIVAAVDGMALAREAASSDPELIPS